MTTNRKFYHELTPFERNELIGKMTYGELNDQYKQPNWCHYPSALEGKMGCWSLMGDEIWKESDCYSCDLHSKDGRIDHQRYSEWFDPDKNLYIYTGMWWTNEVDFKEHYNRLKTDSCLSDEVREKVKKIFQKYNISI